VNIRKVQIEETWGSLFLLTRRWLVSMEGDDAMGAASHNPRIEHAAAPPSPPQV
jgi:hypothetical protein